MTERAAIEALLRDQVIANDRGVDGLREFLPLCTWLGDDGPVPMQVGAHFFDRQYSGTRDISLAEAAVSGKDIVVLKARQIWLSSFFAVLNVFEGSYHTQRLIQVFSKGEREAAKFLEKCKYVHTHLPPTLRLSLGGRDNQMVMPIAGGATIEALPATEDAGRGDNSWRSLFDENAFHTYAQKNFASAEPQARQIIQISTANGTNFFKHRFQGAWSGENGAVGFFFPWWVIPDRQTQDGSPDLAWYEATKRKYLSAGDGFEDDFYAEYPSTIQDAFRIAQGLVYPEYDDTERGHLRDTDPFTWKDAKVRYFGVDWGGGDPTAMGVYGKSASGAIHKFDEFHGTGDVDLGKMGAWLTQWHTKAPFFAGWCDPSQGNSIATLKAAHLPALKADNTREGLLEVKAFLQQKRLTIASRCIYTRKEFAEYRWRQGRDPNTRDDYATARAVDHHADHMDEMRYVILSIQHAENRPTQIVSRYGGGRLAQSAV